MKSSTSLSTPEDFDLAKSWENQYIANDPVSVDEEDGATSGDSILLNAHSKKVPVSKEVLDSSNSAKIISQAVAMSQGKLLEMRTLWLIRMLGKQVASNNPLLFPTMPDLKNDSALLNSDTTASSHSVDVCCMCNLLSSLSRINIKCIHQSSFDGTSSCLS